MPRKNAKSKRPDAERAAEWYAHEILKCSHTCRAVRTQWQRQDLFGCDVIGKRWTGNMVFIQVTAGQNEAVRIRRQKLMEYHWKPSELVQVCQLIHTKDPANPRKKKWFFRIYEMDTVNLMWKPETQAIEVPREWFKSYKNSIIEER